MEDMIPSIGFVPEVYEINIEIPSGNYEDIMGL
jgi:hypothetical protein